MLTCNIFRCFTCIMTLSSDFVTGTRHEEAIETSVRDLYNINMRKLVVLTFVSLDGVLQALVALGKDKRLFGEETIPAAFR